MFVQVIKAKATDAAGLRKQIDRWNEEIRSSAVGFLGSTGGVSEDGRLFVMARFESEEAAQKNSDRPEQGEWWSETEQYLSDPEFLNCTNVDLWGGGGSDEAGFVQIIEGTVDDRESFTKGMQEQSSDISEQRPDVIGGVVAWPDDQHFVQAVYFTSEAEAREGESKTSGEGEDWSAMVRDLSFLDLKEPILS